MKCKKLFCLALSLTLAAGLFSGCGKGSGPDSQDSQNGSSQDPGNNAQEAGAMGRYGERDIPLPQDAANPFGILWEDGALTLYASDEEQGHSYFRYRYENQAWSQPEPVAWMNDAADRLGLAAAYLYGGNDGKTYALAFPCEEGLPFGQYIITSEDGSTALDLTPEPLKEEDEHGYRPYILDLAVLSDGTLALGLQSSVAFYKDGKQSSQIDSIPIAMDHQTMLAASDQTVAVYNPDGTSVDLYQTEGLKNLQNVPIGQDLMESHIFPGTNGVWYLVTHDGIMQFTEKGSIVETLMDGSYGLMGSTAASALQFLPGTQEDFYGLYRTYSDHSFLLKHYSYDEELPASTSASLSIYGLVESDTVNQAVFEFQQQHPEVQVQYNFAAGSFESPSQDAIRSLNAELLNGGGADVLLLDGLPLDSYIEKGVLSDLSDLTGDLKEKDVLMDVIGTTAQKDGKIYALPARIGIPILFGSQENMAALENLDALRSYVQSHPGEALFGKSCSHDLLGMTLFNTMYEELLLEDRSLDEEKLAALLTDWMQICQDSQTSKFEETFDISPFWDTLSFTFNTGGMFPEGTDFVSVEELRGLSSTMISFTKIRESQLTFQSLRNYYVPRIIAGVNSSSPEQELAKEFIRTLYSDPVQSLDSYEGFSVTGKALDGLADYVETDAAKEVSVGSSYQNPDTGEVISLDGVYPPREQVEELTALIRKTNKPFRIDTAISDTVLEELENCYQNRQTPQETAAAICQKVRIYLAE